MKYQSPQPRRYSAETAAEITRLKARVRWLEEQGDRIVMHLPLLERIQAWERAKEAKP